MAAASASRLTIPCLRALVAYWIKRSMMAAVSLGALEKDGTQSANRAQHHRPSAWSPSRRRKFRRSTIMAAVPCATSWMLPFSRIRPPMMPASASAIPRGWTNRAVRPAGFVA